MIAVGRSADLVWDTARREFDRVACFAAGLVMLAPVFVLTPGLSRQICAVVAGLLVLRSAWPRRRAAADPASAVTIGDLVEVEKAILTTRELVDRRCDSFGERIDGITDMVAEISARV